MRKLCAVTLKQRAKLGHVLHDSAVWPHEVACDTQKAEHDVARATNLKVFRNCQFSDPMTVERFIDDPTQRSVRQPTINALQAVAAKSEPKSSAKA
jgi:hypothetical protein